MGRELPVLAQTWTAEHSIPRWQVHEQCSMRSSIDSMRSSVEIRRSVDLQSVAARQHQCQGAFRGRCLSRRRVAVAARKSRSPTRLPVLVGDSLFDEDAYSSQEWLGTAPALPATEGDATTAELDALASLSSASISSLEDVRDAKTAANGRAANPPVGVHDLSLNTSLDGVTQPSETGGEAGARGKLRRFIQRFTPSWLTPRVRGLGLLWLLVALVATNWVLVKDSGGIDALTYSFLRFSVAAAAFSPFLPEALLEESGVLLPAGLELGAWTAGGYVTQALGLMSTDASRASFISTFTVLAVPLVAGSRMFGDGRPIKPVVWISAVGAILGVSLLEQGGSPPSIGDAWSLLSAIMFGIQIYRTEKVSRTLPKQSTFQLMSISLACVAVIAGGAAVAAHPSQALQLVEDPAAAVKLLRGNFPWVSLLWTGLLSTDLALLIELTALNTVSSIDASMVYTAEPVLGAGLAFAFLGERLTTIGFLGAGLILASSLAAQVIGGEDEDAPEIS